MLPKSKKKKIYEKSYRTENSINWNLQEKQQLLRALKRYGPNRMEKLLSFLPKKTPAEITRFIDCQKRRSELLNKGSANHLTAPIEQWHYLAQDLVGFEKFDYSTLLEKILSMSHDYEDHTTPRDASEPDYKLIYKYLSTLFQADELPEPIPSLESAIILDLMHGLAAKINTLDTYPQQMIMKWKYALLQLGQKSDRAGHNPGKMKALLNDFSEFMPVEKSPMDDNTMKWITNGLMISPEKSAQKWTQVHSPAVSRSDSISHAPAAIRELERTVHMQRDNVVRVYPIYSSMAEVPEHMQTPPNGATSKLDATTQPVTPEITFINSSKPDESEKSICHQGRMPATLIAGSNKDQTRPSQVHADSIPHPTMMIQMRQSQVHADSIAHSTAMINVRAPEKPVHMLTRRDNIVRMYPVYSFKDDISEQNQTLTNDATGTSKLKDQTRSSRVNSVKAPCSPITSKPAHSDTDVVTSQKSPVDKKSPYTKCSLVEQPHVSLATSTANVSNMSASPSPKKVCMETSLLQTCDGHNATAAPSPARQGSTKPGPSDASHPASPGSNKPGSSDASHPARQERTKPGSSDAPHPARQESTKPGSSDASHPARQERTKPGSSDAPHPARQESTKPGSSDASHPARQESTKPGSSDASHPARQERTKPGSSDASHPARKESTKPGSSDVSHPARQESTKPGSLATEKTISASNCSATTNKLKFTLRFDKPKLFTLNPFVIPSQFLNMKAIDLNKPFLVRRREADQELRKQFLKAK